MHVAARNCSSIGGTIHLTKTNIIWRSMSERVQHQSLIFTVLSAIIFFFISIIPSFAKTEPPADGIYTAVFKSDSSMFKVNEAFDNRGTLTVKDGEMTLHITMPSKNILNLYPGSAADAKKEGAALLEPTIDQVTYSDGFQDEVYGFDIPVPYLDEEFDLALVGKKGKWYDHKVSVSDLLYVGPLDKTSVSDETWLCEVTLKGGSGRASIESPAELTINDRAVTARIIWSSPYYEYMLVDGVRYEPVNEDGNSAFEIPVVLNTEMSVSASTVAMSQPHLIDYTLYFDTLTLQMKKQE